MRTLPRLLSLFALIALPAFAAGDAGKMSLAPSPTDWIDDDTGHRVILLSAEPGSSTFPVTTNAYSPQGDKFIFNTTAGVALIDITKLGTDAPKPQIIAPNGRNATMSRKTRTVYFNRGADEVYAYNLDTKATRRVPNATSTVFNIDDTISAAVITAEDPSGKTPKPATRTAAPQLGRLFPGKKMEELTLAQRDDVLREEARVAASGVFNPPSRAIVFTNLATGAKRTVGYQYGLIDHLQFSPTDPNLLLYSHEGPWHEVDRIWTIRTDGSALTLRHARTMDMETASGESWSGDGKVIWFDLQLPRSQHVWLASIDLATGKETKYHMRLNWWANHYSGSRDNTLLSSDGSDPAGVAFAKDGKWVQLFRVKPDAVLERELLVKLGNHNYDVDHGGIEPNSSVTPDNKWVVFSSDMSGARQVYAVEIALTRPPRNPAAAPTTK